MTKIINYMDKNIHGLPKEIKDEWDKIKKILVDGYGYIRKETPTKIISFKDVFKNDDYAS